MCGAVNICNHMPYVFALVRACVSVRELGQVFLSHNDTCTEGAICSPSLSCDESGRFVHIDLEHNVTHASLFQPEQVSAAAPLCDSSLESEQLVSLNPPLHIPPTNCIPYHMKNSSISWGIVLSFKFIGNDAQGTVDLASAKASLRGVMGEVNNLSTAQTSTSKRENE